MEKLPAISSSSPTNSMARQLGQLAVTVFIGVTASTVIALLFGTLVAGMLLATTPPYSVPPQGSATPEIPDSPLLILFLPAMYFCPTNPLFAALLGWLTLAFRGHQKATAIAVIALGLMQVWLVNSWHGVEADWLFFAMIILPGLLGYTAAVVLMRKWVSRIAQ